MTETATCQHHWMIEEPVQGAQAAVCKLCGEPRVFRPTYAAASWPKTEHDNQPAGSTPPLASRDAVHFHRPLSGLPSGVGDPEGAVAPSRPGTARMSAGHP